MEASRRLKSPAPIKYSRFFTGSNPRIPFFQRQNHQRTSQIKNFRRKFQKISQNQPKRQYFQRFRLFRIKKFDYTKKIETSKFPLSEIFPIPHSNRSDGESVLMKKRGASFIPILKARCSRSVRLKNQSRRRGFPSFSSSEKEAGTSSILTASSPNRQTVFAGDIPSPFTSVLDSGYRAENDFARYSEAFLSEEPGGHDESFFVRTPLLQSLETLLFLTREPLNARRLAQFLSVEDPAEISEAIARLNQIYDASHTAFRVLEFARGFQLRTRPQFTPWLRQLCRLGGVENQENPEIRLSPPAMETLAIIAYREAFNTPATRAEIEAVRGVQSCMEILRQLLGKDLIRIAGRSTELGRPRLYRTTKKFLEVFGLKSLLQLPRIDFTSPNMEENREREN